MSVAKLRAIWEDAGMRKKGPDETFETFEKRLHEQLQEVERDLLAEELERADVDADAIAVEGIGYRRRGGHGDGESRRCTGAHERWRRSGKARGDGSSWTNRERPRGLSRGRMRDAGILRPRWNSSQRCAWRECPSHTKRRSRKP